MLGPHLVQDVARASLQQHPARPVAGCQHKLLFRAARPDGHRYPSVAAEMAKREGRAAGRLGTLELGIEQLELRFPVFWEHK